MIEEKEYYYQMKIKAFYRKDSLRINTEYPRINWHKYEIEERIKQIGSQSQKEFMQSLTIKDILVKSVPEGKSRDESLSVSEWQRIFNYTKCMIDHFIEPTDESSFVYLELVKEIANHRLHLKCYQQGQTIIEQQDTLE